MKKIFARFLNVLTIITIFYCSAGLYYYFVENDAAGIGVGVVGLLMVAISNYIVLGKTTLWNKPESKE
jgi:hypothetical protein